MRIRAVVAGLGLSLIPLLSLAQSKQASSASTSQLNHNLIKNGDAETEGKDSSHVPAWGEQDGLTEVAYGSTAGEWDWGLSGCAACGKGYLRLAFGAGTHERSIAQTIDVSAIATDIDKKTIIAAISDQDADTTGQVIAAFQDASGTELGKIETPVYDTKQIPKAEKGSTGLVPCQITGQVPAGTRKIVYTWKAVATGDSGDYLGLGDNFSLVLTVQPS